MLILVFLIGLLVLCRISLRFSWLERLGFALPVGLLLVTMVMALMDWVGIGLSAMSLAIMTLLLLAGAVWANKAYLKSLPSKIALPSRLKTFDWRSHLTWFNLLWLLMFMAVVYLEFINFTKTMMYPTYDRDSMAAFDTIGFVCAQEHTYHGMSIFQADYFPRMHEAGSSMSYLPMVQLSYAYVYAFGAETSKSIPAFMYLSFLVGFYGLCRRRLTHTASMLAVLGVILSPEMTSFASHSITNVMHACMASTGVIYTCLWIKSRERRDLWLSVLLLAANSWMRAEGIVFIGVAWLLVFISSARHKEWVTAFMPLLALVPLVLWTAYSTACGLTSESVVIAHPFWDHDKAYTIIIGLWALISDGSYYGWTFNVLLLAVLADIYFILRHKSDGTTLLALLLCMGGYYLVLYQIDYKWDNIYNVLAYSAKRFNFCFVPIAWYVAMATYPLRAGAQWIERHLGTQ